MRPPSAAIPSGANDAAVEMIRISSITSHIPRSSRKRASSDRLLRPARVFVVQGVPRPNGNRGDEYVTLKVMLPERPDPDLEKFVAQWHPATARNPREAMGV